MLDLEVARQCGARVMIGRTANPLLKNFVKGSSLADYITAHEGGHHGLREGCELAIGLLGLFEPVVKNRMVLSVEYKGYLKQRQEVVTRVTEGKFVK